MKFLTVGFESTRHSDLMKEEKRKKCDTGLVEKNTVLYVFISKTFA